MLQSRSAAPAHAGKSASMSDREQRRWTPGHTQRFNLSKWALDHGSLTRYLMRGADAAGLWPPYFQLGQDEDPPFTFRAMVVRTYWPGATAQQVAEQVTDKIERTLQEVPYADKIRSYSKPGESQIILAAEGLAPPQRGAQRLVPRCARRSATCARTLPQGVSGPFFNDEFGDVYGVIYALYGRWLQPCRDCKTFALTRASAPAARARCGQGRAVRRAAREASTSRSRRSAWRSWAWT